MTVNFNGKFNGIRQTADKRYNVVTESWNGYDTSKLDFDVVQKPLVVEGFEIPDKKGIFKVNEDGSTSYLATVSSNYVITKHSDIVKRIEENMNFNNADVKTILSKDGSIMQRLYTLNDYAVEVRKNDEISPVIRIVNSYDGSANIAFYIDAVRLVCTNGMVATSQFSSLKYKHFGERFNINVFASTAKELFNGFEQYANVWRNWIVEEIDIERANLLNNYLPKRLRTYMADRMEENWDGTKWGYYNALTALVTHDYRPTGRSINVDSQRIKLGEFATKLTAKDWYWKSPEAIIRNDLRNKKRIDIEEVDEIIDVDFVA